MTSVGALAQETYTDPANPGGFRHVAALDGIRGLAILMILAQHLLTSNGETGSRFFNIVNAVRGSLWIGVDVFFALSGFLITGILWDTLQKPHFFRNFYARRTLRIFPLYYGAMVTLLLLTKVLHIEWNHWQWYYLTYIANIALWNTAPLITPHVNIHHFWSLQVEEQFYLVWPVVVYRIRHLKRLIAVALLACLVVLGIRVVLEIFRSHFTYIYLLYSPTFVNVDNLLYGCTLAMLLRTNLRQRTLDLAPKVFAFALVCLLGMAISTRGLQNATFLQVTLGMSLLGIGSSAMIAMALLPHSKTAHFFDLRLLRFFGKYSYGLYVYHYTLDAIFTPWLRKTILQHTHSKAASVAGGALVVGALSVAVALLSYHLYEVHFLKLKRFFSYRRGPSQPAPEANMPYSASNA